MYLHSINEDRQQDSQRHKNANANVIANMLTRTLAYEGLCSDLQVSRRTAAQRGQTQPTTPADSRCPSDSRLILQDLNTHTHTHSLAHWSNVYYYVIITWLLLFIPVGLVPASLGLSCGSFRTRTQRQSSSAPNTSERPGIKPPVSRPSPNSGSVSFSAAPSSTVEQ